MLLALTAFAAGEQCDPSECTGMGKRCPISQGLVSHRSLDKASPERENVYFRNESPWPAEISHVDNGGFEIVHGVLPPGLRRALPTFHGDVWRARAVTNGPANGRLLLEHRIGAVPIRECDCPQPKFVDCSKNPGFLRSKQEISDPVVFENEVSEAVDIFYWNGTCEELISWDMVGGLQPSLRSKPILSTQGHSFRMRSAATRRLFMAHTLDDLVLRGCSDEEHNSAWQAHGLAALRAETAFFEREQMALKEALSLELYSLLTALAVSNATAPSPLAHQ